MTPKSSQLFVCDTKASQVLLPLANILALEQLNFGRLVTLMNVDKTAFSLYQRRAKFTNHFLEYLEKNANLRFSTGIPFMYNGFHWSGDLSGYTNGGGDDPLPSHVFSSLVTAWAGAGTDSGLGYRALKATLYWIKQHDLAEGLDLLFDLLQYGFLAREKDAIICLKVLARAKSITKNAEELVQLLIPDWPADLSVTSWAQLDIQVDWYEEGDPIDISVLGWSSLVLRCLNAVERLRKSASLDEWIVNHGTVDCVLGTVLGLVASGDTQPPLALRAVLSQLSEVNADCGGFAPTLGFQFAEGSLLLKQHEEVILSDHAPAISDRLREQRVTRPSLLTSVDITDPMALDDAWKYVHWPLIKPLFALTRKKTSSEFCSVGSATTFLSSPWRRSRRQQRQAVRMTKLINEDVEAKREAILRGWTADQPDRVRSIAEGALAVYPWSSIFRRDLAAALDALEEHERALEVMLEAVFLEPEEPLMWQTLAAMLRNRDREFEYAFAHAMQIRLENRYRWDVPGEDAPAPG
jgi:hypothetical protein